MKKLLIELILLFFIVFGLSSKGLIRRIEPTSWWVGMKDTTVQLLIYGNSIQSSKVSINYPGVSIQKIETTENKNYLFVYLSINQQTKPGKFPIIFRHINGIERVFYELKHREDGAAHKSSFSDADVVYLIMPDRFVNANRKNDSIKGYVQGVNRNEPAARHGGDIEGVVSKLPYLADLGVTTIWTTPLFENNDTKYSYHHYSCTDYYKVDPRFGTNADYRKLSDECHQNNLKLIIDIVPNHCGINHWWTNDIPSSDWYHIWKKYTSTNYRITSSIDIHGSDFDKYRLTHGWFAPNMPDLNLENHLLFDYLRQAYIYWIEYANLDGIRVDTYPYNELKTASRFIQSIRSEYQSLNVVGECWVNSPAQSAYFMSGNNNKDGFDSRITSVMDFSLQKVFGCALVESEGWDSGLIRFYNHFAQDFLYPNVNLIMNFIDNHDVDRFSTIAKGDLRVYKMAIALLITSRGYPQLYYGTEIMLGGESGSYEGSRYDFPGGFPGDSRNAFTAEGRTAKENEIFSYIKALLHFRKSSLALQQGKLKQFIPEDGCYVMFRYNDNELIMVIANNTEQPKVPELSRYEEMLFEKHTAKNIITNKVMSLNDISVPPKSVIVLEIK